ncbi:MAG: class II aldolase/adducin family protein [Flavobacteriales bacterium]|nr:class II aldolase/adducin family protein [Flavobacteriales bacterium]
MKNKKFIDEGYIKFNCKWIDEKLSVEVPQSLKFWRDKLFQLKQIGYDKKLKVGYGNISVRIGKNILISGTQTGSIFPIEDTHFTLVTNYDISKNEVVCRGKLKASSETMTHAAIYQASEDVNAIIHIHNKSLWGHLSNKVPATNKEVAYGTPDMAFEIVRLFNETDVIRKKIIVMKGHEDGIIVFGSNLDDAGNVLLSYL